MLNDFQDCYRLLELKPDATLEEVKRAYRELVKVWHPDRFTEDALLQQKAQEKLKQINLAYERISERKSENLATRLHPPVRILRHLRDMVHRLSLAHLLVQGIDRNEKHHVGLHGLRKQI